MCTSHSSPDDTIDESYGVAVVFHEEEDEEGARGEKRRDSTVAYDDDDVKADDDDEGMEADYDEVLKTAVSHFRDLSKLNFSRFQTSFFLVHVYYILRSKASIFWVRSLRDVKVLVTHPLK